MELLLRQKREDLGLSLRDAGALTGREASGLAKVELGKVALTLRTLRLLARAYQCHPLELISFADEFGEYTPATCHCHKEES